MIIAEVEFLRGLEWQRMESMGLFFCEVDACKCKDMQADHVEMHYCHCQCANCYPERDSLTIDGYGVYAYY
jgi:hypothetical protein